AMQTAASEPEQSLLLSFPARLYRIGQGKRLIIDAAGSSGLASKADPKLVKLLVRVHRLKEKLRAKPRHQHRRSRDAGEAEPIVRGAVAASELSRAGYHPGHPRRPSGGWLRSTKAGGPRRPAACLARAAPVAQLRLTRVRRIRSRTPLHLWPRETRGSFVDGSYLKPVSAKDRPGTIAGKRRKTPAISSPVRRERKS